MDPFSVLRPRIKPDRVVTGRELYDWLINHFESPGEVEGFQTINWVQDASNAFNVPRYKIVNAFKELWDRDMGSVQTYIMSRYDSDIPAFTEDELDFIVGKERPFMLGDDVAPPEPPQRDDQEDAFE
jgi:hypothetical protein